MLHRFSAILPLELKISTSWTQRKLPILNTGDTVSRDISILQANLPFSHSAAVQYFREPTTTDSQHRREKLQSEYKFQASKFREGLFFKKQSRLSEEVLLHYYFLLKTEA